MRTVEDRRRAQRRGVLAESAVADLLSKAGWTVLFRNWRGTTGELDLVVQRDGALRIVEVKAREEGDPAESIGPNKRRRLIRAAEELLSAHTDPYDEVCFMLALLTPAQDADGEWQVEFIDNAFDA